MSEETSARYEYLEREYPCDKRTGIGMNGCCGNKKIAKNTAQCALHGYAVHWTECADCPYQERIGRHNARKNK